VLLGAVRGATAPLWFDEISTLHIAELPTWHDVFRGTQTLDLNPPLEVFLVRLSTHLLGPHELAARLPSILGYALAVGCLFVWLARRLSPWFAAFGSLLLIFDSGAFYYATEARGYAVLLGLLGLGLLAYDRILQLGAGHGWARAVLFISISAMLLTHVFAVFPVAAFLLAEALRTIRLRRIDVLTWLALLLPLVLCMLYGPLIHAHNTMLFPPEMRPALHAALRPYSILFLRPIAPVLATSLVLLLLLRKYPQTSYLASLKLRPEAWLLLLTLLATPITIALVMSVRDPLGGYFARYGLPLVYPASFFLVSWIAWRSRGSIAVARALTVFALIAIAFSFRDVPRQARRLMHRGWLAAPGCVASSGGVESIYPNLPLVANDGEDFMEADNRLSSSDLTRLYDLTDPPTAVRLTQSNALEDIRKLRIPFRIRANFATLGDFTAQHRQFLVIGDIDRSTSWLMRWAQEQHAEIRFLGNYAWAGKFMPLWLVTLKPAA